MTEEEKLYFEIASPFHKLDMLEETDRLIDISNKEHINLINMNYYERFKWLIHAITNYFDIVDRINFVGTYRNAKSVALFYVFKDIEDSEFFEYAKKFIKECWELQDWDVSLLDKYLVFGKCEESIPIIKKFAKRNVYSYGFTL